MKTVFPLTTIFEGNSPLEHYLTNGNKWGEKNYFQRKQIEKNLILTKTNDENNILIKNKR